MKKLGKQLSLVVLGSLALGACQKVSEETEETKPALDLTLMDSTVNPTDDFFKYVNGQWLNKTEIPGDKGRWGSFDELRESNNKIVLEVLKSASESGDYGIESDQYKASTFYNVGMDSLKAEEDGISALEPYFEKIEALESKEQVQGYLAEQLKYGGGAFFYFAVFPDLKISEINAAYLAQGGLSLPDRDYYTKTDSRSKEIQEKYEKHIARMLQIIGDDSASASAQANRIMALETRLAEASMTNVEQRNIPALYNKYPIAQLKEEVTVIDWDQYFADLGVEKSIDSIIVMQPKFMAEVQTVLNEVPLADIKDYLRWKVLDESAGYLNAELVSANFDFFGKELRGVEEMEPRWKRVLSATNGSLGEAIGKLYVDAVFPPEAKQKAKEMVTNIQKAYEIRINKLEWMTDSTKAKATEKLDKMTVKIGYPDKWKDYGELEVGESYSQNILNANYFVFKEELKKLGEPVDRSEWGMSPQTVNAYFNPLNNEIVFPAAILQPPFYNYQADDAVNYGGIGAVIGHEISHCFDDQGSRFDASGNMVNWWTDQDAEQFQARTQKLVDQYDAFEPLDSVHVNGALTLGENIGDLGGINAAYDGLMMELAESGTPEPIDGLSAEQRFFMSWGTIWRTKYKDESLRTQINTDPHSPGMYRANGPLANLESFYEAFDVKEGDPMWRAPEDRVKIW